MVEHKHIAALAVFAVLVIVGSGFLATGNVVISNPTSHNLNLYVNTMDFPAKHTDFSYAPAAIITNTGAQSVTFINYELTVQRTTPDPKQTGFAKSQGSFNIGAGETKTIALPGMDINSGEYSAVFKIDVDDRYVETDETDNTYTTTFIIG